MTPDQPLVAIVIVNWNGWRDTLEALASLERSTYRSWRLIIVDNASSDGSLAHFADLGPRVTVVASAVNTGFAGGVNLGVAAAAETEARYIFLLNNDATVREDTLEALVTASRECADDAVLGAVVRYKETGDLQFFGSAQGDYDGGPLWFRHATHPDKLADGLIATDFVFGAAFFSPTRLFSRVGSFDERFFLTYEETDWCYRARRLGVSAYIATSAVVEHVGSASLGSETSPLQAYFLMRNELLFKEKHAGWRHRSRSLLQCWRAIQRRFVEARAAGFGLRRLDPTLAAMLIATRDYAFRRFGDCPPSVRALAARARAG